MQETPATRHSLIVKLRDPADHVAWNEFVAINEPLVYQLARRKGLQDADARDVCQEVLRASWPVAERCPADRLGPAKPATAPRWPGKSPSALVIEP